MLSGLYVVGTPIGNLDDLSPRAIETLRGVNAILTEDTRRTRILLDRFGLKTPTLSCHKFNEASRVDGVLDRLHRGDSLALVSDAGMPGVSDPGSRVVAACRKARIPVICIPGPSSVTTAVALSGFNGSGFVFAGFTPRKSGALRKFLQQFSECPAPIVIFESPYRLVKVLDEIESCLGPRDLFLGRELTKKFEETLWGTPAEIRQVFQGRTVKGEIVMVIAPAAR
ncbi:MAG: 16S rRNA (cytidine(1402)-2'-O)-methyltransferase [bacterium]